MENNQEKKQQTGDLEKIREDRKSKVRVYVTYVAAGYLFLGGGLFIIYLIGKDKLSEALTLFNTLLPVAAGFVSFWFAGRGVVQNNKDK